MLSLLPTILLAATLASALPSGFEVETRQTTKTSYIQFGSKCAKEVYYQVFQNAGPHDPGHMTTQGMLTSGQSHEIDYGMHNLGIVIKAGYTNPPTDGPILQFEIDKNSTADAINYDISAVNGLHAFQAQGYSMYLDKPNGPCYNIECQPGDNSCAFLFPKNNIKDHSCPGLNHIVYAQVCDTV